MIRIIDNYVIDADDKSYILGELIQRENKKKGGVQELVKNPRYFTTLPDALKALCEVYKKREVHNSVHSLKTALLAFERLESQFEKLLKEAMEGK